MQRFNCPCGNLLFFGSSYCLVCKNEVGYDPESENFAQIIPSSGLVRCKNGTDHGICNWLVSKHSANKLCESCRLNDAIPSLDNQRNVMLWGRMEIAKRRLIYALRRLNITLHPKANLAQQGLAFNIVSTVLNPNVTTGHLNGIITVNLEEADDTYRQINRQQLGENSRTLLGHFRHESAHYLWSRFLSNLDWGDPSRIAYRERFGDEWIDYGMALERHYQQGPPADWQDRYISGYAASHPWEDWAETWSHYLLIVDGLETCEALGLQVQHLALPLLMMPVEAGFLPTILKHDAEANDQFLAMLQRWMCMSTVLNEISNSLGEAPLYPFLIPVPVAQKLRLAHYFATNWGTKNKAPRYLTR